MSNRVIVSVSFRRAAYDAICAAAARARLPVSAYIRVAALAKRYQESQIASVSGSSGVMVATPGWSDTTAEVKVHD